jgi:hypothetical protein
MWGTPQYKRKPTEKQISILGGFGGEHPNTTVLFMAAHSTHRWNMFYSILIPVEHVL